MNLFVTTTIIPGSDGPDEFLLEDQEAYHASKVMRIREGDEVHATDGQGVIYAGRVSHISSDSLRVSVDEMSAYPKPSTRVIIAVGNIKNRSRMELAVEKAVELGAMEIIVFQGDKSEKKSIRIDRLEATALSAMKQSSRAWMPVVREAKDLPSLLKETRPVRCLVADETKPFSKIQVTNWKREEKLLFVVGPEGGFSDREKKLIKEEEIETFSLGSYRLRTETAVIAIATLFLE